MVHVVRQVLPIGDATADNAVARAILYRSVGLISIPSLLLLGALLATGGIDLPDLHAILDTAVCLLTGMLAWLLWDVGVRGGQPATQCLALGFATASLLGLLHALVVIPWGAYDIPLGARITLWRPSTWPPPAHILPLSVLTVLALRTGRRVSPLYFAIGLALLSAALLALFRVLPPYSLTSPFGISRPTLLLAPLLWAAVGLESWRSRGADRVRPALAAISGFMLVGDWFMLFSRSPHDTLAMAAHLCKAGGFLCLLVYLMQLGVADMHRRVEAECELKELNATLDSRIQERTERLETANRLLEAENVERKRAEAELDHERALLRTLIDALPDTVFTKDAECRFVISNPAAVRLVGLTSESEMAGKTGFDLFPRELAKLYHADDLQVLRGEPVLNREEPSLGADGKPRWYLTLKVPQRSPDGEIIGIVGVSRDITDHRRLEEQLRQSQKMDAIGRLAGGVAHDFNNMLTVINGYSALLLGRLPKSDMGHEMVQEIAAAGARAASLTRQLLAFSRKSILEPRVLDLRDVVADLDKMLRRIIGEDIQLTAVWGRNVGLVNGDPGQIEQVILNLVVNARDAMPEGGNLTIEVANAELDRQYADSHLDARAGRHVLLSVTDTGCGMDAATAARIWEPFFTTKAEIGTGLGLSTVYGIVKQSGGHIAVYTEPGAGATFKVYLPRVDEEAASSTELPEPAAMPLGEETILLAEDDDLVRNLVREILSSCGFTVLAGRSAPEALRLAAEYATRIDLLVTDVVMPGMSGRELAQQMAEQRPGIKVLFLSGYTDDAVVRHGILEAQVQFLQKPFTPHALAAKVRSVLDGGQRPDAGTSDGTDRPSGSSSLLP